MKEDYQESTNPATPYPLARLPILLYNGSNMKTDTHPTYYKEAEIRCACGNVIKVGGTKKTIEIEICGACHPYYTGKEKLIDTTGRVEKFKARVAKAKTTKPKTKKE